MGAPANTDIFLMFITGLVASLHCVLMCGPLVIVASSPLLADGGVRLGRLALWQAAYQLGRGAAYGAIGVALGFAGTALAALIKSSLAGSLIEVVLGALIIAIAITDLLRRRARPVRAPGLLSRLTQRLVVSGHGVGLLGLGLLTGLLPCGILYAAMARALVAGSAVEGGLLMLSFWCGTLPLLFAAGLASSQLFRRVGRLAPVLVAMVALLMGGWLMTRGGLHIAQHSSPNAAVAPAQPTCPFHHTTNGG